MGTTDTGVLCKWGYFYDKSSQSISCTVLPSLGTGEKTVPHVQYWRFSSSSAINSTWTSFDQLHIFTRKDAPIAQFFHVCAFWHVTRGTWGHRVTKKRRTPKEICWSSSRTSNNNPVSSFFFRSRPESTPAATVVKHFVTSHSLFCIRAIADSVPGYYGQRVTRKESIERSGESGATHDSQSASRSGVEAWVARNLNGWDESGARADWQACTTHPFLLDHRTSWTVFRVIVFFAMTAIASSFTTHLTSFAVHRVGFGPDSQESGPNPGTGLT